MKKEYPEGKEKVQGNRIRILDKDTINKIAAGEVIERPASVVKELIDNSIDARATDIRIEIEKGGKRSILVRDNGCGMSREDALLAYKKHATSNRRRRSLSAPSTFIGSTGSSSWRSFPSTCSRTPGRWSRSTRWSTKRWPPKGMWTTS